MKHTYRITGRNERKHFNSVVIIVLGFFVILPLIFYYKNPDGDFWAKIHFCGGGFLIFFIPLCIIHFRYHSLNEGVELVYDDMERKVSISNTKKSMIKEFSLDEIKYIFHTMSAPMTEKRMHWFPWDSYNYSEIFLNSGEKYIITSLMIYKLELPVGDKYQVVTSFYPYPKGFDSIH